MPIRTVLALFAAALALAACASAGGAAEHRVEVSGFRFQPDSLTVPIGATVEWSNADGIDHTATAGAPGEPNGGFAIAMPKQGASGSHTFDRPGTYAYFCEVHESMTGEVIVEG